MTKIAIIGAGGYEFPLQLMNDFLSFPSTRGARFALMVMPRGNAASFAGS